METVIPAGFHEIAVFVPDLIALRPILMKREAAHRPLPFCRCRIVWVAVCRIPRQQKPAIFVNDNNWIVNERGAAWRREWLQPQGKERVSE